MNQEESLPLSSSLPFEDEVRKEGTEGASKGHKDTITSKKRIEAIIPSEKTDSV